MALPLFHGFLLRLLLAHLLLAGCLVSVHAQVKFEKEERIKSTVLPSSIQEVMRDITPGKKGKWYKETSLNGESYEYKAIFHKRKYSIEFSSEGALEDVEILLKKEDISTDILQTVCKGLNYQYKDFKVLKTQIQISPSIEKLGKLLEMPTPFSDSYNKYELIVEVPTEKGRELREILLAPDGTILSSKKIISGNPDNLEF